LMYLCYFFFQAEDGIRDKLVTGVQTCALPISAAASCPCRRARRRRDGRATPARARSNRGAHFVLSGSKVSVRCERSRERPRRFVGFEPRRRPTLDRASEIRHACPDRGPSLAERMSAEPARSARTAGTPLERGHLPDAELGRIA